MGIIMLKVTCLVTNFVVGTITVRYSGSLHDTVKQRTDRTRMHGMALPFTLGLGQENY